MCMYAHTAQSFSFVPTRLSIAMSGDQSYDWSWEHLLAENPKLMDEACSLLLRKPEKAEEVPEEDRPNVLMAGYGAWAASKHMTTTRGAVLFKQLLNMHMVCSAFQHYRDCFLFALSVSWDVDVQRFDLMPDQSQAAFAYVEIMRQAQQCGGQQGAAGRDVKPTGAEGFCGQG